MRSLYWEIEIELVERLAAELEKARNDELLDPEVLEEAQKWLKEARENA